MRGATFEVLVLLALLPTASVLGQGPPPPEVRPCTLDIEPEQWADAENARSRLETPIIGPRLRDLMASRQPAILIVAEDRSASYLGVSLRLSCPALAEAGAFVATTDGGETRRGSGALIIHGDPENGILTDTRKGAQRIDPKMAHEGRNMVLVRFEGGPEKIVSVEVDPEHWRWLR